MTSEKRTSQRLKAILPIDFSMDEESVFLFYRSIDISRAGVYITTNAPLPVGAFIDVVVSIRQEDPNSAPRQVVIKGEVVHSKAEGEDTVKGPGMGVKFIDITDEEWDLVKNAAASATNDNPLDMAVVADPSDHVRHQLDMIREHSKDLREEAKRFVSDSGDDLEE